MDYLLIRDALKYEVISILLHSVWSYIWMYMWMVPFGDVGRYLAGFSVIVFLAGNEISTARQVRHLLFHLARVILGVSIALTASFLIHDVLCTKADYSSVGAMERSKKNCVFGYHFLTHIGVLATVRASLAFLAFTYNFLLFSYLYWYTR